MKAKVKNGYRWPTLIAFNGVEFNKKEFTLVPPAFEKEAEKNPNLEFEPVIVEKVHTKQAAPVVQPEPEIETFTRSGRNKKPEG